jgi:glutamine synthetase
MAGSQKARKLLGDAFVTGFCAAKTVEYDSYLHEVGAWERRFLGPQA